MSSITGHNVTKLAAAAGVSPMTVRRWASDPERVTQTTREHIERGLRELGMRAPALPIVLQPGDSLKVTFADHEPAPTAGREERAR